MSEDGAFFLATCMALFGAALVGYGVESMWGAPGAYIWAGLCSMGLGAALCALAAIGGE